MPRSWTSLLLFFLLGTCHLFAQITVTTTNDVVDGNTSDIFALQASPGSDQKISLREAIIAANHTGSYITISVPAGTYNLTRAGTNEDFASTGDLDIRVNQLTIAGTNAATTIIQQTTGDRVFDINPANAQEFYCTFQSVTISGGAVDSGYGGGGILYSIPTNGFGTLTLTNCIIANNHATNGPGGGIEVVNGYLTMTSCTVTNNAANTTYFGEGGGIDFFAQGTFSALSMDKCVVDFNQAGQDGGGLHITGDLGVSGTIYRSDISSNICLANSGRGAGIVNGGGNLTVRYCRLENGSANGSAVYEESTGYADVAENWWGANNVSSSLFAAGPGFSVPNYTPFLTLTGSAKPSLIVTNASSTLEVDIFTMSDSAHTRLGSNLFVGLPPFPYPKSLIFTGGSVGTITTNATALTNGIATAVYTARSAGIDPLLATVEGITVPLYVTNSTPATVFCPADIVTGNDAAKCSANVSFAATASGYPTPTLSYKIGSTSISSPYTFPQGTTTVIATATNATGTNSCSFNVTVNDIDPPQITCPATITVNSSFNCPVAVNFTPTATDNCGSPTVTATPPSGSLFFAGTNTVLVSASDSSGNTNTCSFLVVVNPSTSPLLTVGRAGTNVSVSWPSAATCYTLQWATNLAYPLSNKWVNYPGPFYSIGTNTVVTNSTPSASLYRLKY